MKKKIMFALILCMVLVTVIVGWSCRAPEATNRTPTPPEGSGTVPPAVVSLATGLEAPWALDFLPDGRIILTERPGRIRLVSAAQVLLPEPLLVVNDVIAQGESGLLGIAVHPEYSSNGFIYVYYTYEDSGNLYNRVRRYIMENNSLVEDKIIVDNIPAGGIHDGGRIKFGPDGLLYITAGDAGNADAAQDISSLNGKILRVKDDGGIPENNPFPGSLVYSYGHRNPEGLAWDSQGRLWATEHGSSATDELNLIEPGKNYGWPIIRGNETREGMVTPVINSGSETWAPSGAAYRGGNIFFTGLRGQSLFEAVIYSVTIKSLVVHLNGQYGRLREVVVGPDGFLYLLTSNRDGRGSPSAQDDRLFKINPVSLN
jgi:glucose/arabinose dehydrogenase